MAPLYKFLLYTFVVFFSFINPFNTSAQITSVGREFWMGFMDNRGDIQSLPLESSEKYIFLSSDRLANVNISVPNTVWQTSVVVNPNTAVTIRIPGQYCTVTDSEIAHNDKAVLIKSDNDINCYAMSHKFVSTDGALILPTSALGSNYLVNTYTGNGDSSWAAEFLIVAVEDNTVITIEPTYETALASSQGRQPTDPFTITLNKGELYQVKSIGDPGNDFTGTRVYGVKNFALFAGHESVVIPVGYPNLNGYDHLFEQMLPVNTWRNNYVAIGLATRDNSSYRIMALLDGTTVTIDGASSINLNRYEFAELRLPSDHFISGNNPISVAQYSECQNMDNHFSDPFMIMLSPVDQLRNNVTFNVFDLPRILTNYLNISIQTNCVPNVTLDGVSIASAFRTLPYDPTYSIAKIQIGVGVHTLLATNIDCGFNAYIYGYGRFESYGYSAGIRLDPVSIKLSDTVVCVNQPLEASILAAPYKIKNYNWSFGDGASSALPKPVHSYGKAGTYTIKLLVDYEVNNLSDSGFIRVRVIEPKAEIDYSGGLCNSKVSFQDKSVVINGSVGSRLWNFGDNSSSIEANPVHFYKAPGKYKVILTLRSEVANCIAYDTVEVEILPPAIADAGGDISACVTKDSIRIGSMTLPGQKYKWTPSTGLSSDTVSNPFVSAGTDRTYYLAVRSADGCFAYDTVNIKINKTPVIAGVTTYNICAGDTASIIMNISGGTPPYKYSWSPLIGLSAADIASPRAFPDKTAIYTFQVTDKNGCISEVQVTVRVEPKPSAVAGKDVTICHGDSVKLGDNAFCGVEPFAYKWTPSEGLSSSIVPMPFAAPVKTTKYIVEAVDALNRKAYDTVIVTVNPEIRYDAGNNAGICAGSSIKLGERPIGGTPPFKTVWTPQEGLSDASSPEVTATPDKTITYYVELTDAAGCSIKDSVLIEVFPQPKANAGEDTTICAGSSVALNAGAAEGTPPYSYNWIPTTGLSSTNTAQPVASPTSTTEYIVKISDANGCSAFDTVIVNVNPIPHAEAGPDYIICDGDEVKIGGKATCGLEPYTYKWIPLYGLSADNIAEPIANPNVTTTYIVVATDALGRADNDTITITVNPLPVIEKTEDITICEGGAVDISVKASGSSGTLIYNWSPQEGLSSINKAKVTANPRRTTTYTVVVTDSNGCYAIDSITIFVSGEISVEIRGEKEVCLGAETELKAEVKGGTPPYFYKWSPAETILNPNLLVTKAKPLTNTLYILEVTDANGCRLSSEFEVNIISAYSVLKVPDTLKANPRQRGISIPVYLTAEDNINLCSPDSLNMEFELDMSLFKPISISSGSISKRLIKPDRWRIKTSIPINGEVKKGQALFTIIGDALLGKTDSTYIEIKLSDWTGISEYNDHIHGLLRLTDICEEGGKRLLSYNNISKILSISPNPAIDFVDAELELSGFDFGEKLIISDAIGRKITSLDIIKTINSEEKEIKKIRINISELNSGVYNLMLKSQYSFDSKEFIIIK